MGKGGRVMYGGRVGKLRGRPGFDASIGDGGECSFYTLYVCEFAVYG